MLTNNYKIWANTVLSKSSKNFINFTDINGVTTSSLYPENSRPGSGNNVLDSYFGAYTLDYVTQYTSSSIFIGTGAKEESQEDIALESLIPDSDLTMNSANAAFSENKFFFTKTFTYIGTNDITINEIAFYKTFAGGDSNTICLARQKIEPLTVSQNDMFTVTMVIG